MRHTHKLAALTGVVCTLVALGAFAVLGTGPERSSIDSARSSSTTQVLSESPPAEITDTFTPNGSGRLKSAPKPPKHKGATELPPPTEPQVTPAVPPAVPEEPPVVPDEPPVVPEPELPPAPPAAPGAANEVACVSADMADVITFTPPATGEVSIYSLLRSATEDGEYSLVTTATADACSFTVPVSATGTWWYRIGVTGPGGEGPLSTPVSNDRVLMSAEVSPEGRTLASSNGEIALTLAPGSYTATTTVTVTEVSGSPTGGLISLAGVYEITPTGPLGAPATVKIAYALSVEHFQVADAILSQAGLMTYDEAGGEWVTDSVAITADDTYLTGTLSHFSYWTLATVQPHGTSTTAYCSTGPATEGGFCHDLSTYPGSATRIAARDAQVCYNCHGSPGLTGPPAGATGENVQAAIEGAGSMSRHPVMTGGLYCTACHDPHADPTASPGLLKAWNPVTGTYVTGGGGTAPGNDLCWTCHGAIKNRRIDYLHPGYYTDSGGDKKTAFQQTAHGGAPSGKTGTAVWDATTDFDRGMHGSTVGASDSLAFAADYTPVSQGKPYTMTPSPSLHTMAGTLTDNVLYDGQGAVWESLALDENQEAWVEVTVDLGMIVPCDRVLVSNHPGTQSSNLPQTLDVSTSVNGTDWITQGSTGSMGTDAREMELRFAAPADARYVRFRLGRRKPQYSEWRLVIAETGVHAAIRDASWVSEVVDISYPGRVRANALTWTASIPEGSSVVVEGNVSLDHGASWLGWQELPSGAGLPFINEWTEFQSAVLQTRVRMHRDTPSSSPQLHDLRWTGEYAALTPTAWPASGQEEYSCGTCHLPHGSGSGNLARATGSGLCYTCHDTARGGFQGETSFAASAHSVQGCDGCHDPHGRIPAGATAPAPKQLVDYESRVCLGCHGDPSNSRNGVNIAEAFSKPYNTNPATPYFRPMWSLRHNVDEGEQAVLGNSMKCSDCHGVHAATGERTLIYPDDPSRVFEQTVEVPRVLRVPAIADAQVTLAGGYPQGSESWMYVSATQNMLLRFDLNAIPAGAQIIDATLVVRRMSGWSGVEATNSYKMPTAVYRLTESWDETTVTWSNRGGTLGAWTTPGGTDSGMEYASGPWGQWRFDATQLLSDLRTGPDYGVLVRVDDPAWVGSEWTDSREGSANGPYLEVRYHPAEGPDLAPDSIAFCTRCHSGVFPDGVMQGVMGAYSPTTIRNVGGTWANSAHGGALTPAPNGSSSYRIGAKLRLPYYYGYPEELQCTLCHDPHGSGSAYHLRETPLMDSFSTGCDLGDTRGGLIEGYWCGQCHYGATHLLTAGSCLPCHTHVGGPTRF